MGVSHECAGWLNKKCAIGTRRVEKMRTDQHLEIEQFLYRESRLLDEHRFRDWLELLADDIRYVMPLRWTRYTKATKAVALAGERADMERDSSNENEMAYYDESKETLRMRIERIETGMAWAEEPPSRTRRIVTNIEVRPAVQKSELEVYSNLLLFRSRLENEEDIVVGQRQDTLRPASGSWQVARRKIVLAHNVLNTKNLSMFF